MIAPLASVTVPFKTAVDCASAVAPNANESISNMASRASDDLNQPFVRISSTIDTMTSWK
jgi:hypothetical protein